MSQDDRVIFELWYSVENQGDGSAYPKFFCSQDKAQQHQERHNTVDDSGGWAEDCTGVAQLTVDSDNAIQLVESVWIRDANRRETKYTLLPRAPEMQQILMCRFNQLLEIENKYLLLKKGIEGKE